MEQKVVRASVSADVRWIGTCRIEGPQGVHWHVPTFQHGETVVVIPASEYERLCGLESAVNQSFERQAGRAALTPLTTIEINEYERLRVSEAAGASALEACTAMAEAWRLQGWAAGSDAWQDEKAYRDALATAQGLIYAAIAKAMGIPAPVEASQADGQLPDGVAPTTERS